MVIGVVANDGIPTLPPVGIKVELLQEEVSVNAVFHKSYKNDSPV